MLGGTRGALNAELPYKMPSEAANAELPTTEVEDSTHDKQEHQEDKEDAEKPKAKDHWNVIRNNLRAETSSRRGKRKGHSLVTFKDLQDAQREAIVYHYHSLAPRSSTVEFPATGEKRATIIQLLRKQYNAHEPNIVETQSRKIEVIVPRGTPDSGVRKILKTVRYLLNSIVKLATYKKPKTSGQQIEIRVPKNKQAGDRFLIELAADPTLAPVDLHSDASLLRREAIRFDPRVVGILEQMWCWSDGTN